MRARAPPAPPAKCRRNRWKLEPYSDAVHQLLKRLDQVYGKSQQQQDDVRGQRQDEAASAFALSGSIALRAPFVKRGQNINYAD